MPPPTSAFNLLVKYFLISFPLYNDSSFKIRGRDCNGGLLNGSLALEMGKHSQQYQQVIPLGWLPPGKGCTAGIFNVLICFIDFIVLLLVCLF